MSGSLLKDTRFRSEVRRFFKEKKMILDIFLFGSSVRGKEKPNDIDILVVYPEKKDIDTSYELKKRLRSIGLEAEITDKTYKEMLDASFKAREGILSEGFSLIYDRFLHEGFGYLSYIMIRYSLTGLNKSDRMRWYYSLYGRSGKKGVLSEYKAVKFTDTIILCPVENIERFQEYLSGWKIKFQEFPILLPERFGL